MKLTFIEKKEEAKNVETFVFKPEEKVDWQPGQYMHYLLDLPKADDKGPERWFTISYPPYTGLITITTRLDNEPFSAFKQYLMDLKPGDQIESDGPKGKFLLREDAARHILIAGGIGITPYYSMLAQLTHKGKPSNASLLYSNRDNSFVFDEELSKITETDSSFEIKKFSVKHIEKGDLELYVKDPGNIFYLSGPKGMVESYEHLLPEMGVSPDNIVTDYFPGYN
jgi:ferredoxin-NADP reductase